MSAQITCSCSAYKFPHRLLGGKCNGYEAVNKVFENGSSCQDCHFLHRWRESRGEHFGTPCSEEMAECRVLEDLKLKPTDCPGLQGEGK